MDELYDGFIEKTDYLIETKGLLKDRINSLGGSITSGTTFRDYLVWLDSLYEALDEKTITGLPDSLEGKCEQDTTPSKNLYNANDTTYYSSCTYVSGANTNQYKVKATGTDLIINSQVASGSSYSSGSGTLIPCKYGETIYYDIGNSNFTKNFITQYNSSKVSLGFANTGSSSGSYTPTNSACEYISIRIGYGSATSGTEYTIAPIISKSSNLDYEPYTGPVPNPNNPRPINITTGRQVVSVVGKNLLPISDITNITGLTRNEDKITLNGTFSSTSWTLTNEIILKANTTYTLSLNNYLNDQSCTDRIILRNGSTNITQIYFRGGSVSYTPTQDTIIDTIRFYSNGYSFSNYTFSIQLEKGNQATTYEEYKGGNYEINLGNNLFKTPVNATSNGITLTNNSDGSITLNGTATANAYFASTTGLNISTGAYTLSYTSSEAIANEKVQLATRTSGGTRQIWRWVNQTSGSTTSTTTGVIDYTQIAVMSGTTLNDYNIKIQLEKGSVASSFSPYKTPIYLGKIGTYQDCIFKNTQENPLYDSNLEEGQWYIHKEIGRVVLNGSESWAGNGQTTDFGQYVHTITDKAYGTTNMLCNTFNVKNTNAENSIAGRTTNSNIYITIEKSIVAYNTNTFKTWLSSHNVELYYVLNTPTNTLIEDEELINQLNEIEIFTVISEGFYN